MPPLAADDDWFYELRVARAPPTVNLTRTPAKILLPAPLYETFLNIARTKHAQLARITRIGALAYLGILFINSSAIRTCVTSALFVTVTPIVFIVGLLSVDVIVALLKSSYEFWFLSLLNFIHWLCIACIFNDIRSFMCLASVASFQAVLLIDANFRTFAAATKSVSAAIPGMLLLGALCGTRYIVDARFFHLKLGYLLLNAGDIVVFTSSTLSIFMIKLAYRKRLTKQDEKSLRSAMIHCVMFKAVLELAPRRKLARRNKRVSIYAIPSAFSTISKQPKQPIKVHGLANFVIDARDTLVPGLVPLIFKWPRAGRVILYAVGGIGFLATTASWIAIFGFQVRGGTSEQTLIVGASVAIACTAIFSTVFGSLAQRDLLQELVHTFDFNFSVAQALLFSATTVHMTHWRPPAVLAATSWWLWFQWVLLLDTIPPPIRSCLGLSRRVATPVIVLVLLAAGLVAFRIVLSFDLPPSPPSSDPIISDNRSAILDNMRLLHLKINDHHDFELRAFGFTLQRILTLIGWSSRLAMALAWGGERELLFLRGSTRYATPFATFPPNAGADERRRRTSVITLGIAAARRSRSVSRSHSRVRPASLHLSTVNSLEALFTSQTRTSQMRASHANQTHCANKSVEM